MAMERHNIFGLYILLFVNLNKEASNNTITFLCLNVSYNIPYNNNRNIC